MISSRTYASRLVYLYLRVERDWRRSPDRRYVGGETRAHTAGYVRLVIMRRGVDYEGVRV